jgi:5'-nucleotidase (lipoprotein e(P4) family)
MFLKSTIVRLTRLIAVTTAAGCAQPSAVSPADMEPDLGILWVRDAAEYRALSLQAYGAATEDLPRLIGDTSWSALPYQADAHDLPPAIIFDVDETLVTNVMFQVDLQPPFRNSKLDDWNAATEATAVPGAPEFVRLARASGVRLFYVTNRPCEAREGSTDPCPQKAVTIQDLNEAGIPADASNVMMSDEKPGWTREKKVRRDLIAESFRVIMLVGDDLGDFIPCVRARPSAPCTEPATKASRRRDTERYAKYWGEGWYVLPNPMHGSWTTVQ